MVDDDPEIARFVQVSLEAAGFATLDPAHNGEIALGRIDEDHPDLVILNLVMPLMDGFGVLERLREREDSPPVVMLSAQRGPDKIARALELGAVEYVTKPFDPPELARVVEAVLEPQRGSPDVQQDRREGLPCRLPAMGGRMVTRR